jgi:expansin (peptidoglycan-binding protein)
MVHGQRGDFSQDGYGQDGYGRAGPGGHRRSRRRLRRPLLGLGVTGAGVAAVALAVMVGIGQFTGGQAACTSSALSLSAMTVDAGTVTGIATHYVLEGVPNCSYSPPANGLFVALSPSEYNSAAACGGYISVTGPNGNSVTVEVIDQCPECASGHIDLSEPAFAELAPLSAGLIDVHYQYLVNPPLPGPVTMEVKQGSSQYWLALLAGNTGNPLASVQVETASGGWVSLARANYNYWIAQSGAGSGPFTVRLTDTRGNTATVTNVALNPGTVQSTGTYMYGAGGTQTAPTPARSSASPTAAATSAAATASAATKRSRPSHSPAARPSATGGAAAKRRRVLVSPTPHAIVLPNPDPAAPPPC